MPLPDNEIERVLAVVAHPDDVDFGVGRHDGRLRPGGAAGHVPAVHATATRAASTTPRASRCRRSARPSSGPPLQRSGWATSGSSTGLQRRLARADLRAAAGDLPGDPPGPAAARGDPEPRPVLGPARRQPPGPPGRGRGDGASGLPGRPQPVLLARAASTTRALQPWTVQELWMMAHPEANHPVDITDDLRPQARRAQGSREPDRPRGDDLEERLRQWGPADRRRRRPGRGPAGRGVPGHRHRLRPRRRPRSTPERGDHHVEDGETADEVRQGGACPCPPCRAWHRRSPGRGRRAPPSSLTADLRVVQVLVDRAGLGQADQHDARPATPSRRRPA